MSKRGLYIVIEGLDGSGKTTQFEKLAKRLPGAIMVREPGGTPMGERIRELIKSGVERSAGCNAFLFSAARADLIDTIIRPAISNGRVVISDRNWLSTVAYQTADGAPTRELLNLCRLATREFFEPDLTILIDVDVATARERLAARGDNADYFESKGDAYLQTIRENYIRHVRTLKNYATIDGSKDVETVASEVWSSCSRFSELLA